MKRLTAVLLCIFLVSCNKAEQDYFSLPRALYVTLESGETTVTGRLETGRKKTVFYPDTPKGLEITVTENGGTLSYEGLVFENSTVGMTYIYQLHEALSDGSASVIFGDQEYPDTVTADGIRMTVHKELN